MGAIQELISKEEKWNPRLERRYENAMMAVQKLEERLQKLYAFNASSASIFSEYESCLAQLNTGISAIANSGAWNASSGTFNVKKMDMRWAKPITKNWNKREKRIEEAIRNQSLKENREVAKDFVQKDVIEDTVFPMNQDVGLEMAEDFMLKNGDKIAVGLYNTGTKQFGGTNISSAFYAGSKMVGAAGKAMPLFGALIDFGSMVAGVESDADAVAKTGAHAFANIGIGLAVAGLGLSGGWAIVAVAVGSLWVNDKIDTLYDYSKKKVGDSIKSIGKWIGNAF